MKNIIFVFILAYIAGIVHTSHAQIFNKIKKEAEKAIIKEIQKKPEAKTGNAKQDSAKKVNTAKTEETKAGENVRFSSSTKYDFVPGDKVILYDDFSQDAVGDFPALWTANAAGEINTINIAPGNWFNLNSTDGNYFFLNDIDFPKNFIIEFDIVPKKAGGRIAAGLMLYGENKRKEMDNNPRPGNGGILISIEKGNWNTLGYKTGENDNIAANSNVQPVVEEKVNHVIIWVQGRRVRIYHQQAKVLDIPTNIYDGVKLSRLGFKLSRGASCGSYISNLRITNAAPDMRSKLLTEGKLVSYGIYFDVNKDVVKSESFGTLKEISKVLTDNPDVKIKIVGHTDADGDDKSNLDLSKRRAASVKNVLVNDFGIDAARIETDGKGESEPIAQNDSAANKALNRRVEFLKS